MNKTIRVAVIMVTAMIATGAGAQVVTPPGGAIKTQGPYLKYPFLKSAPPRISCSVDPKLPFPEQRSPNCPLPPATPCLVAQRCSNMSKPGTVVPL